jgi:ABC-type Zn2+ transport system substrate-binding protein/surface adhesin
MHQFVWKPIVLALAAVSLAAVAPATVLAQDHPQDHPEEHRDQKAEERHDDNRPDPAAKYRHDHPRSSARCHDGFFTTTKDRGRACSKHGGIDVWLAP